MLDWYSGHRTDEVAMLIQRKGHVLLFHGGGTTPWTQVNDTHLHAFVQKLMVVIENKWESGTLRASRDSGRDKIPSLTRVNVLQIVVAMWRQLPHNKNRRERVQADWTAAAHARTHRL